jgi:hypothetical protein
MDGLGLSGLDVAGKLLRISDLEFRMPPAAHPQSQTGNPQSRREGSPAGHRKTLAPERGRGFDDHPWCHPD